MKKLITIVIAALMLAAPVMAVGPVWTTNVNIDANSDRLHNNMNGGFNSGTFSYSVDTTTGTHSVTAKVNYLL